MKNAAARRLSLQFLENKDVVKRHQFHYDGVAQIEVDIDVKVVFRFRDELLGLYAPPTIVEEETPSRSPTPALEPPFVASMKDLEWQNINIRFLDGLTVKVSANDANMTVDYRQMGFEDARNRLPNTQWHLLKLLAKTGGQLSWEDSEASDNFKKKKQLLADTLKAFFRIKNDPFYPYKEQKAYRTKFSLKAEGD